MSRIILTLDTMFQVLRADKLLRERQFSCRVTPTPPGLSLSVCGMSIELLDPCQMQEALEELTNAQFTFERHEVPF